MLVSLNYSRIHLEKLKYFLCQTNSPISICSFIIYLKLANYRLDFADNEDVVNLCQTLLQAYIRRMAWINDQSAGENKIDSRLDDMEKVRL